MIVYLACPGLPQPLVYPRVFPTGAPTWSFSHSLSHVSRSFFRTERTLLLFLASTRSRVCTQLAPRFVCFILRCGWPDVFVRCATKYVFLPSGVPQTLLFTLASAFFSLFLCNIAPGPVGDSFALSLGRSSKSSLLGQYNARYREGAASSRSGPRTERTPPTRCQEFVFPPRSNIRSSLYTIFILFYFFDFYPPARFPTFIFVFRILRRAAPLLRSFDPPSEIYTFLFCFFLFLFNPLHTAHPPSSGRLMDVT